MTLATSEDPREIVTDRLIHATPEKIFRAFAQPEHLAQWWGPRGFRNTFEEFDFRPGGHWKFVMHGPDGVDYDNHSVFREIDASSRVVLEHLTAPHFVLTVTLTEEGEKTRVDWRGLFDTPEVRDKVATYAVAANEQNLDRLEAELAAMSKADSSTATAKPRQIFVNLPIKNMERSKAFFTSLGFSFNPQFTNEQGACMVISPNISIMLLVEPFFQTFTNKPISDATRSTEVLICLSCESRAEVDSLVKNAIVAGGTSPNAPQDHGFMYGHGFTDLDGHIWELAYMDPNATPPLA